MFNVITLVFRCRTDIVYSCFVTVRDRVILFKSALKHMFEECLLDYLATTIVFISWKHVRVGGGGCSVTIGPFLCGWA